MRGDIDSGDHRFRPRRFVGFVEMYGRIHDPGMGPYPHRVALAPRAPGWDFHTVRGGIDPGDNRFCPRYVRVVAVWKDL